MRVNAGVGHWRPGCGTASRPASARPAVLLCDDGAMRGVAGVDSSAWELGAFDVDGVDEQVVCCIRRWRGATCGSVRAGQHRTDEDGQARQKPAAKMYEGGNRREFACAKSVHAKRVGGEGLFVVREGAVAGVAGVN